MADYSGAENADPPEIVSEHPITAYIDDDGDQGSSSSSFEHLDPSPPATSAVSSAIPDVSSSISGLRERSRTPYTTASADPGLSDILPIPGQLPRAAADPATDTRGSSSKSKGKGKERAVDDDDDKDSRCAAGTGTGKDEQEEESSNSNDKDALFACHICLETPRADDCVVTKCGHVFCWSDLSEWLESNPPATSQCPVCKSQIKDVQEEVIPIYSGGRSSKKEIDPRTRPRPKPKVVPAPTSQTSAAGSRGLFGVGGGFQGISPFWDVGGGPGGSGWTVQAGVFPFPGLSFGWSSANGGAGAPLRQPGPAIYARTLNPPLNPQEAQEQARIQQRNALILFGIMILLFTLLATISEMD